MVRLGKYDGLLERILDAHKKDKDLKVDGIHADALRNGLKRVARKRSDVDPRGIHVVLRGGHVYAYYELPEIKVEEMDRRRLEVEDFQPTDSPQVIEIKSRLGKSILARCEIRDEEDRIVLELKNPQKDHEKIFLEAYNRIRNMGAAWKPGYGIVIPKSPHKAE